MSYPPCAYHPDRESTHRTLVHGPLCDECMGIGGGARRTEDQAERIIQALDRLAVIFSGGLLFICTTILIALTKI